MHIYIYKICMYVLYSYIYILYALYSYLYNVAYAMSCIAIGRTDREQIRSRINNNDCRTFRPRRPLSTAYKTKETAA